MSDTRRPQSVWTGHEEEDEGSLHQTEMTTLKRVGQLDCNIRQRKRVVCRDGVLQSSSGGGGAATIDHSHLPA